MTLQASNLLGSPVEIIFDRLQGAKIIGGYGLSFQFKTQVKSQPEGRDFSFEIFRAEVWHQNSPIGVAFPSGIQQIPLYDYSYTGNLSFLLNLNRAQLDAMEELRNGQDISLSLWVHGICCEGSDRKSASGKIDIDLNQRQWTDALKPAEYSKYFTFEVPFPVAAEKRLGSAISYLEKASESFSRGDYEETVSRCRNALENLHSQLLFKDKMDQAKKQFCGKEKRDMDLEERIFLLHESVRHITHPAHHPEGAEYGERYLRKDAKLVLSMTAAIISHSQGA